MRKKTKEIQIGNKKIGGDNPILVQSMTNTKTSDIDATIKQIHALEDAGCDIIRVAVNSEEEAKALKKIKEQISIPIIADIQYDYKLALASLENGADKIRINPGNIGSYDKTIEILKRANELNIPIRIGVNTGSIDKKLDNRDLTKTEKLVESAAEYIRLCEDNNFDNIVISLKASSVPEMIEANRMFSERFDYPLHLGVTEAGLLQEASIKSAIGIGSLLYDGIGDTIRVSITGNPVDEVIVAREILDSLDINPKPQISIVSCPTCGRTNVDLIRIAGEVKDKIKNIDKKAKVAIMGCPVNGPGEAKDADLGIAGGNGSFVLFRNGQVIRTVEEDKAIDSLIEEIEKL